MKRRKVKPKTSIEPSSGSVRTGVVHLPTTSLEPWNEWSVSVALGLIWVMVVLAYANTLGVPFFLDDIHTIVENPTIRSLWPPWTAWQPPKTSGITGRPVINFTLALNYALSGYRVWSYHLLNLFIHVMAAWTLFGIVRRTLIIRRVHAPEYARAATGLALGVALIWAVHPLHTSAVTYIIQRSESLMGLFFLLTLYMSIRGWQLELASREDSGLKNFDRRPTSAKRIIIWHIGAVLAGLAGMGCKEVMVAAPAVVLLYDLTFVHRDIKTAWQCSRWLYVGLLGCIVALGLLVVSGEKLTARLMTDTYDAWQQLTTQPQVITHYLRLAIWPDPLVFDYRWPPARTIWDVLPYALILVTILLASIRAFWQRHPAGFLGLSFFVILAPSSSIVPQPEFVFEYKMYLPLACLVALLVIGAYKTWTQWASRSVPSPDSRGMLTARVLQGLPIFLVVLSLGILTFIRNYDYRSELTIWADTVRKRPQNYLAHSNYAAALGNQKKYDEAIAHIQEAASLRPQSPEVHYGQGALWLQQGQPQKAIPHFYQALKLAPEYYQAHLFLGLALDKSGRSEEAIKHLQEAIRLKPDQAPAHFNLGVVLNQAGQTPEALRYIKKSLELDPGYGDAQVALGTILLQSGQTAEALLELQHAVQLTPQSAEAHSAFGAALTGMNQTDRAITHFREAVRLKPTALRHFNLGLALSQAGQMTEAKQHFTEALKLDTSYAPARQALKNLNGSGPGSEK